MATDKNPRGEKRPKDGRGGGTGRPGGLRGGKNPDPCGKYSPGGGRGKGTGRPKK